MIQGKWSDKQRQVDEEEERRKRRRTWSGNCENPSAELEEAFVCHASHVWLLELMSRN